MDVSLRALSALRAWMESAVWTGNLKHGCGLRLGRFALAEGVPYHRDTTLWAPHRQALKHKSYSCDRRSNERQGKAKAPFHSATIQQP
jgi:hypothetical protein